MKLASIFPAALLTLFAASCTTVPSIEPISHRLHTEGTDFWVCFEKNYRYDTDTAKQNKDSVVKKQSKDIVLLQLALTASSTATVTIETAVGTEKITIQKGEVTRYSLDTALQVTSFGIPEKQAVHITSDYPISVRGSNSRHQTTDAFTAIPLQFLGREYRVIGFDKLSDDLLSQFAIVATDDETDVTITPRVNTGNSQKANIPFTISLKKGDVYQVRSCADAKSCDITGTLVQANKNIAVFSGHNCAYVPWSTPACNHLVEQLLPIQSWGKQFGIGTLARRKVSTFRIVAHEPETHVSINDKKNIVLNAGEHYTDDLQKEPVWITADKPILVAHYGQGFRNGDSIGDAMMLLVRPVEQFQTTYTIVPPLEGKWQKFVNVIIAEEALSSLQLDGEPVDALEFIACGTSPYVFITIPLSGNTAHTLTAAEPFGISCYGFGYDENAYDAYGNM